MYDQYWGAWFESNGRLVWLRLLRWPIGNLGGVICSLEVGPGYGRLAKVMDGELIGSSAVQQGSDATICCLGARAIGHVCEAVHGSECFVNPWAFTVFGDITI